MEKKIKPIPDLECLKYKGTPQKPDIKIFVSQDIDSDNVQIENPLFIPLRCGAVFDKRENIATLGDDTGDNISNRSDKFKELTCLYWMWKNVKADYYGLFKYNLYLSFSEENFSCDPCGFINEQYITQTKVNRYGLTEESIRLLIEKYDIIVSTELDISQLHGQSSIYTSLINAPQAFKAQDVDKFISLVKKEYPEMSEYVNAYFAGKCIRHYDCSIMRAELFDAFCQWMYPILFQFVNMVNVEHYSESQCTITDAMGEALFGIFLLYIVEEKQYKIKELQPVFFSRPKYWKELDPSFKDRNVPVVLMSSNQYVPYCAVAIQSIINTHTDMWNYDIIILQSAITEENQKQLKAMVDPFQNMSIRFYDPMVLLDGIKLHKGGANSIESYYRMFSPYLFQNYARIIAMDSDLIVKCDIAKLYQIDMCGKVIGAVHDATWCGWMNTEHNFYREYAENVLNLPDLYAYFNTGVLVFDLERFRELYSLEAIIACAQNCEYRIQEQDALNVLLYGEHMYIEPNWNVYTWDGLKTYINAAPKYMRDDYLKAREDPYIVHFAGNIKPWKPHGVASDMANEFWSVARKTIFYEHILIRTVNQAIDGAIRRDRDKRKEGQWHQIIKKKFIMPIFKLFLPYGSPGYVAIKAFYFKLRRQPYDRAVDVAAYRSRKG